MCQFICALTDLQQISKICSLIVSVIMPNECVLVCAMRISIVHERFFCVCIGTVAGLQT